MPDVIRFPPFLFFSFLLTGAAVQWQWPLSTGLSFEAGMAVGIAMLGIALAVGFAAVSRFQREGTSPDPGNRPERLVTGGIFARTRNPLYIANPLVVAAIGVMTDAVPIVAASLALWIAFDRLVVPHEERILTDRFGEEYVTYMRRVPRWW